MEQTDLPQLPPVELEREWPADWSLSKLAREGAVAIFPAPSRYLHPALELKTREGRGRCMVAKEACPAGTLILVDKPLVVAKSRAALQEESCKSAGNQAFRKALLYLCRDDEDQQARAEAAASDTAAVSAALVARILRRNCRLLSTPLEEAAGSEGDEAKEGDEEEGHEEQEEETENKQEEEISKGCGIWPVASLVNHALRPNVVRVVIGHTVYLRLLADVSAGDEVVENYLSPLLPRSQRLEILRASHDIKDEGPDEFDSPVDVMAQVGILLEEASDLLEDEQPEESFKLLADATNLCSDCSIRDPAFADAFSAFAKVAGCLGGGDAMQLEGAAMALEFATARQAFSVTSCRLAVDLLHLHIEAMSGKGENVLEELQGLEHLVREHMAKVYGEEPGLFEALCPVLAQRLEAARKAAGNSKRSAESEDAAEGTSKRPKTSGESKSDV